MYGNHFDDDDVDIDAEEALKRAYALGVASVCADPDDEAEYERLKEASPDTYDESILELAFEEGRAKALDLQADAEDPEEVWDALVTAELDAGDVPDDADAPGPSGLPDALTRPDHDVRERLPESLDLPSFLTK